MIKTILWDFDGVIAESVNVKTEAFHDMYKDHGSHVSRQVVEHHLANGGISRFEKFKHYHREFLNIELTESEIMNMAGLFSDIVLKKVIASPYIPGVFDFIKNTQERYSHYVISGTPHDEMNLIVDKRGLRPFFKEVMGSPKTKTEWIRELAQAGKIQIETSVFIGDATTDYNAATKTGTKFVLREVDYNLEFFTEYAGPRVKDFTNFERVIEAL